MMTPVAIETLKAGQAFRLFDEWNETPTNNPDTFLTRVRGVVQYVSSGCSVCVKLESRGTRTISTHDKKTGESKEIVVPVAANIQYWSLRTPVVVLKA